MKNFRMPTAYTILFILLILVAAATWVVPAGSYQRTGEAQVPAAGTSIPGGSTVVLYLGDAAPEDSAAVPDVTGMTYENAKNTLERAGFFMRASGVATYYGNSTTAERQSVAGGDVAAIGTVVDVRFFNVVEDGYT